VKIGLFLIDDKSLFQGQQKAAAEGAARGRDVELEVFFAGGESKKQREQMFAFVRRDTVPAAIIVEPVEDTGLRFVAQEGLRKGCAWVLINRTPGWVGDLAGEQAGLAFCVTADQKGIGRVQGEQFRILAPSGGTVLYVTGPALADVSQERLTGMEETRGSALSVVRLVGAWTEASGYDAVHRWVETTRGFVSFNLVGAQNDDMAVGAKKAVVEAGRQYGKAEWGAIPALGVDGMPAYGQQLVDQKELAATVIMPTTTGKALDLLVGALRGGSRPPGITTVPVESYPALTQLRS
jgi:inositol transport system substrate-binding protein